MSFFSRVHSIGSMSFRTTSLPRVFQIQELFRGSLVDTRVFVRGRVQSRSNYDKIVKSGSNTIRTSDPLVADVDRQEVKVYSDDNCVYFHTTEIKNEKHNTDWIPSTICDIIIQVGDPNETSQG